jgi:spermidine/putrescine transport system permease protein
MKRAILAGISALLYLFLYAPIAVVMVYSFNAARHGMVWRGFTWQWYEKLLHDPLVWAAAKNTLILAVASTSVATVFGALLGVGLYRYWFPGKRLFQWFLYLPVVIPDVVMAVAMMLFYGLLRDATGWFELGMGTMIVAHVTFQIPFVALVVRSRLIGLDPAIEEAARDLGASPWQTFWYVTFPLIAPGIMAGGMLAFTLSLDDFVVSFFTTGPGATTLPILIYSSVKRGITPDINALSTVMILVSVLATIMVAILERTRKGAGTTKPNL